MVLTFKEQKELEELKFNIKLDLMAVQDHFNEEEHKRKVERIKLMSRLDFEKIKTIVEEL